MENLRTLEKAQRFYDDVILFCEDCNKDEFLEELRLICYAIVVESTHNLYYKEDDPNNTDSVKKMVSSIENTLEHRIGKYLYGTKSSNNLTGMLLRYYQEGTLDKEQLEAEYRLFLKSGDKPNYYKTDAEIKVMLPDLKKGLLQAKNIVELNEFADSYMVWSDILEEDNEDVLTIYKNGLNKMLKQAVRDGKEEILTDEIMYYYLGLLNSKLINYVFISKSGNTQVSANELNLLPFSKNNVKDISAFVSKYLSELREHQEELDRLVCEAYDLSVNEINMILDY